MHYVIICNLLSLFLMFFFLSYYFNVIFSKFVKSIWVYRGFIQFKTKLIYVAIYIKKINIRDFIIFTISLWYLYSII